MSGFKNDLSAVQADALRAFQARLAADIEPLKEGSKNIILWGVELVPDGPKVDVVLLKFLRAREFKVADAATMLVNCIKWRRDFKVDQIFEESFVDAITSLGFLHKYDKQGRPVMYNQYGNINSKEAFDDQGGIDKFIRWRVQLMEKAILHLDMNTVEDMVVVHDYNGASFMKMDKNMKQASRTLIALFQDYYPELLARKYFVNIPWFFETIYNVVSTFVSQRTKEKFVVCAKSSVREKLLQLIPVENLPVEYGGLSQLGRKSLPQNTNNDGSSSSSSSSAADTFYSSSEPVTERAIEPSTRFELQKEVEAGSTLVWEFTLLASDVNFQVKSVVGDKTVDVLPLRKSEQHVGTHTATETAKYVLTWDNTSFFARQLVLFYKVFVVSPANTTSSGAQVGEDHAQASTTTSTNADASTLD